MSRSKGRSRSLDISASPKGKDEGPAVEVSFASAGVATRLTACWSFLLEREAVFELPSPPRTRLPFVGVWTDFLARYGSNDGRCHEPDEVDGVMHRKITMTIFSKVVTAARRVVEGDMFRFQNSVERGLFKNSKTEMLAKLLSTTEEASRADSATVMAWASVVLSISLP
jgi:hypothetical protein